MGTEAARGASRPRWDPAEDILRGKAQIHISGSVAWISLSLATEIFISIVYVYDLQVGKFAAEGDARDWVISYGDKTNDPIPRTR